MEMKDLRQGAAVIATRDLSYIAKDEGQFAPMWISAGTAGFVRSIDPAGTTRGWRRVVIAFDGHATDYSTDPQGALMSLRLDPERSAAVREHRADMRKLAQNLHRMLGEAMMDGEDIDSETLGALHAICARVSAL